MANNPNILDQDASLSALTVDTLASVAPNAQATGTGAATSGATAATNSGIASAQNAASTVSGQAIAGGSAAATTAAGTAFASAYASQGVHSRGIDVAVGSTQNYANLYGIDDSSGTIGQVLTATVDGDYKWQKVCTVQTGVPTTTYITPLVYDNTAVTGGLYAWTGAAYVKISNLAS